MFNNILEQLKGRQPKIIGSEHVRHAAVVIPLVDKDGQWYVLFEVRSGNLRRQPGEICFPGGRVEPGEEFKTAALRELCEELQMTCEKVEIIAPMDIHLAISGQMVVPYLAVLSDYDFTWNKDEVENVFLVPLKYFLNTQPDSYKNYIYTQISEDFPVEKIPMGRAYPWQSGTQDVYFYEVPKSICYSLSSTEDDTWTIWGLTARIMHAAAHILNEKETMNENEKEYC